MTRIAWVTLQLLTHAHKETDDEFISHSASAAANSPSAPRIKKPPDGHPGALEKLVCSCRALDEQSLHAHRYPGLTAGRPTRPECSLVDELAGHPERRGTSRGRLAQQADHLR